MEIPTANHHASAPARPKLAETWDSYNTVLVTFNEWEKDMVRSRCALSA